MAKLSPNIDSSKELLIKLSQDPPSTQSIRNKILKTLFLLHDDIRQVDVFLARLHSQGVLEQDPVQLRELYPDEGFRIMNVLQAVKKLNAVDEVVLALKQSGNEQIIATLLHLVDSHPNCPERAAGVAATADQTPEIATPPSSGSETEIFQLEPESSPCLGRYAAAIMETFHDHDAATSTIGGGFDVGSEVKNYCDIPGNEMKPLHAAHEGPQSI